MSLELNIVNILYVLLVIPFALVMEGIRRKAIARMQNRIGPPIIQPIYDILKLFKKGKTDTLAKENLFFKVVPIITFLIAFGFFLFLPLNIISFKNDFIFLIYLLVLESALFVLAGFASNNPYSAIASMRELILMVSYEMIFTIVILGSLAWYTWRSNRHLKALETKHFRLLEFVFPYNEIVIAIFL